MPNAVVDAIHAALSQVEDPEIRRPITDLGMVKAVEVDDAGRARVEVFLTISHCPMRSTLQERVEQAVVSVPGVTGVDVVFDVMSDEQRNALRETLQGPRKEIPFAKPGSLTKVLGVASGKGGVGKSSITVNLAVQLAAAGLRVGLVDADVYGHSTPRLLGVDRAPTVVDDMYLPPVANGVASASLLPHKRGGWAEPVAYRGPMLHRVLTSFLTDYFWGDLDWLLLDLPPGTGDVAMSLGQLLPNSELLIVTTPQVAAAEVAVRAGMMAAHTKQRIVGVVENMSGFPCPHCGEPIDLFGSGGGSAVSRHLSQELGTEVPLLARIPFDVRLREGGDAGRPLVLDAPDAPASQAIVGLAETLAAKPRGLAGMNLGISPVGR